MGSQLQQLDLLLTLPHQPPMLPTQLDPSRYSLLTHDEHHHLKLRCPYTTGFNVVLFNFSRHLLKR